MKRILVASAFFTLSALTKDDYTIDECSGDATDSNDGQDVLSILACMDQGGFLIGI